MFQNVQNKKKKHTLKHLTLPLGTWRTTQKQQQSCIMFFFLHTNLKFQLKIKFNIIFSSPIQCYI